MLERYNALRMLERMFRRNDAARNARMFRKAGFRNADVRRLLATIIGH